MGLGDFAKEEFSKEELEALGKAPAIVDDTKKTDEGAGKSPEEIAAAAAAKADGGVVVDPSKAADEKKPVELSTEEKTIADQEGVKLITDDKGKQWLVDDEGAKIPVERWRKNFAKTHADVETAKKTTEETNRKLNLLKELRS